MKKLTPLPSVEEVYETTLTKEDNVSIPNLLTQERNQAYTSLVEGIAKLKKVFKKQDMEKTEDQKRAEVITTSDVPVLTNTAPQTTKLAPKSGEKITKNRDQGG